jgi:hypothetical protein
MFTHPPATHAQKSEPEDELDELLLDELLLDEEEEDSMSSTQIYSSSSWLELLEESFGQISHSSAQEITSSNSPGGAFPG